MVNSWMVLVHCDVLVYYPALCIAAISVFEVSIVGFCVTLCMIISALGC